MRTLSEEVRLLEVTPDNVAKYGVFCLKNKKAPGYAAKIAWMQKKINRGVKMQILVDNADKQLGFVEYMPAESAWRSVYAPGYVFVQCIYVARKPHRNQNLGSMLLGAVEKDARKTGKAGICTLSSDGPWLANKSLFENNGFSLGDSRGRFDLLYKPIDLSVPPPRFFDWSDSLKKHQGWHLLYANQCPWHEKSVTALTEVARKQAVPLQITKLETAEEVHMGPCGYGTFALIKDGKLLADHYLSATRFKNILKEEMT